MPVDSIVVRLSLPAAAPMPVCTALAQGLLAAFNPSRTEMPLPDDQAWRSMPAEWARMHRATDTESARLRAAHLNAVLADIGCALLLVWAFSPGVTAGLWLRFVVMTGCCDLALADWQRHSRQPTTSAAPETRRWQAWPCC